MAGAFSSEYLFGGMGTQVKTDGKISRVEIHVPGGKGVEHVCFLQLARRHTEEGQLPTYLVGACTVFWMLKEVDFYPFLMMREVAHGVNRKVHTHALLT